MRLRDVTPRQWNETLDAYAATDAVLEARCVEIGSDTVRICLPPDEVVVGSAAAHVPTIERFEVRVLRAVPDQAVDGVVALAGEIRRYTYNELTLTHTVGFRWDARVVGWTAPIDGADYVLQVLPGNVLSFRADAHQLAALPPTFEFDRPDAPKGVSALRRPLL
jgi:hypothetical protein